MKLIDADKFLAYLIYSGLIDDVKCGNIVEAVEKCEVKAILLDKVEQIRAEIKHFMYELNPNSSESDYACNYVLEIIDKVIKEVEQ